VKFLQSKNPVRIFHREDVRRSLSACRAPTLKLQRKLTDEVVKEIDRLLEINEQMCNRGQHKQTMKKIDILESLQEKGYDIGYTTVCNYDEKDKNSY